MELHDYHSDVFNTLFMLVFGHSLGILYFSSGLLCQRNPLHLPFQCMNNESYIQMYLHVLITVRRFPLRDISSPGTMGMGPGHVVSPVTPAAVYLYRFDVSFHFILILASVEYLLTDHNLSGVTRWSFQLVVYIYIYI